MADTLLILTFHDIDELPSAISFSPKIFAQTIRRLFEEGYQTISISRVVESLTGKKPFPERSLAITFDDGYESLYRNAFPVLQKHGMTATVFLTVGRRKSRNLAERLPALGGKKMLSWKEIRDMERAGINIGSHTLTHPDLRRLPLEQIQIEILDSKTIIEDTLGCTVSAFAYPFGYHNREIREVVQKFYSCACSARLGITKRSGDPFALQRVDMYYFRTERLSRIMLTPLLPLYVQMCTVPRQIRSVLRRGRLL